MAAHIFRLALGLAALAAEASSAGSGDTCAAGAGGKGCSSAAAAGSTAPLWPRARGHLGSYGVVKNLTGSWDMSKPSLVWTPYKTRFHDVVLGGPLIDAAGNFYVTSSRGLHKVSASGRVVWRIKGAVMNCVGSLSPDGSRLYNVDTARHVYAVDTATGAIIWSKQYGRGIAPDTAYVESHDGVVVYQGNCVEMTCMGSETVYAVRTEDGSLLWKFDPDNPTWNLMPMFPEDDTVVFQDYDSVTYRLGLHNGTLLWKAGGMTSRVGKRTWTDGGCILGNNGAVYTVSSKADIMTHHKTSGGGVHAYRLSDGKLLWERDMVRPVFTWPVVGRLAGRSDSSVIVAVGANGYFPLNIVVIGTTSALVPLGLMLGAAWSCCCCLRRGLLRGEALGSPCKGVLRLVKHLLFGLLLGVLGVVVVVLGIWGGLFLPMGTFDAEVYALDAETGAQQWVFKLHDWKNLYSKGDWEGAYDRLKYNPQRPFCLPAAFNSPTIDAAGVVYIGYMDGAMYALKDANGDGVVQGDEEVSRLDTEGAFLHSGAAIVPGLMAVTSCNELYVWKT